MRSKRSYLTALSAALMSITLAWPAAAAEVPPERSRIDRELEIMSGILDTTLKFVRSDLAAGEEGPSVFSLGGGSPVQAYYLYDQGATFVISTSSLLSIGRDEAWSVVGAESSRALSALAMAKKAEEKLHARQEAVRRKMEEAQESVDSIKVHLLEAIANHGDSLSVVQDDEYVNLVLAPRGGLHWAPVVAFSGTAGHHAGPSTEIVSLKKSWILDYKAGRLTLAELKGKAIEY